MSRRGATSRGRSPARGGAGPGASRTACLEVTTTTPTRRLAERIAQILVEERLAACAQVIGPLRSVYRWRDAVETAAEWFCILKTTTARYAALEARLRALHSYQTPEIIAVPVGGSRPYLEWLRTAVSRRR